MSSHSRPGSPPVLVLVLVLELVFVLDLDLDLVLVLNLVLVRDVVLVLVVLPCICWTCRVELEGIAFEMLIEDAKCPVGKICEEAES